MSLRSPDKGGDGEENVVWPVEAEEAEAAWVLSSGNAVQYESAARSLIDAGEWSEALPDLAYDVPHTHHEAGALFGRVISEAKRQPLTEVGASRRIGLAYCRQIANGVIPPEVGGHRIWSELWNEFPEAMPEFTRFVGLMSEWDDSDGIDRKALADEIVRHARSLLKLIESESPTDR